MNPILVKVISMVLYLFIGYGLFKLQQTFKRIESDLKTIKRNHQDQEDILNNLFKRMNALNTHNKKDKKHA